MAGFERALDHREEAEHLANFREMLYPNRVATEHPIEKQAAEFLSRYAFKKFSNEWRQRDLYAIKEITKKSSAMREFEVWRFERPNVTRRVTYNDSL